MKYKIIKKEVEVEKVIENEVGEQVVEKVMEEKDFVQETIVINHKKDEFIGILQQQIIEDEAEISRRQSHKAEIESELAELTKPKAK